MVDDTEPTAGEQLALDADWPGICRAVTDRLKVVFAGYLTAAQRGVYIGTRGAGGDATLEMDDAAEQIVLEALEELHGAGAQFTIVSEEVGIQRRGSDDVLVLVDPIDGSLNARRGIPGFSVSIAVAHGDTMADVFFGFVYDFGTNEEWLATKGGGATLNGEPLDRSAEGCGLEVLGVESAKPSNLSAAWLEAVGERVQRLRVVGSIAITLCQVAGARFDGMSSLRGCRSIDAAAGQLIVREAGGVVSFGTGPGEKSLGAPLDLYPHAPVFAARSDENLAFLTNAHQDQ